VDRDIGALDSTALFAWLATFNLSYLRARILSPTARPGQCPVRRRAVMKADVLSG